MIHADKHGFLAVPPGEEKRLLEAARFMDANECDTVIPAARSASGKTAQEILAAIDAAGAQFGKNARAKFAQRGVVSSMERRDLSRGHGQVRVPGEWRGRRSGPGSGF